MQTFVPYSDMDLCAQVLDDKRLGKQRSESLIILATIEKKKTLPPDTKIGWKNHPAVLMWEGHEDYLVLYSISITMEWIKRGYKDSTLPKFFGMWDNIEGVPKPPKWWGDERVHQSHRSKLVQKNPEHYAKLFHSDPKNLEYFWPSKELPLC